MKKTIVITILAALPAAFLSFYPPPSAPRKHALLIGVGAYQQAGWRPLNSDNDVSRLREAWGLAGIQSDYITTLTGEVTGEKITKALAALARRVNPGDYVVVHFSGHGQQTADDDDNEENDGLDETLVPWDAPSSEKAYCKLGIKVASRHYRDDDFGKDLEAIRRKLGPLGHLVVFLDSCFSGTGTKGAPDERIGRGEAVLVPARTRKSSKQDYSGVEDLESIEGLSKFVVITASRSTEKNYEYSEGKMGSLSYAIYVSLQKGGLGRTYRQFYNAIKQEMDRVAKDQNPTAEGDLDSEMFAMGKKEQSSYFTILDTFRWATMKETVFLSGGKAAGIYPGDIIDFAPAGKPKEEKVVTGKVTIADPFQSTVQLERKWEFKNKDQLWAYVRGFGQGSKLRVQLSFPVSDASLDSAARLVVASPFLTETKENPQVKVELRRGEKVLQYRCLNVGRNAQSEWLDKGKAGALTNSKKLGEEVQLTLIRIMAGEEIRTIAPYDSTLTLKVSFKPVTLTWDKTSHRYRIKARPESRDGLYELNKGDTIGFEASNVGRKGFYYSIVNVESIGRALPIYPLKDMESPSLAPGQSYVVGLSGQRSSVTDPGLDIYRVFISTSEYNMVGGLYILEQRAAESWKETLNSFKSRPITETKGGEVIQSSATITIKMKKEERTPEPGGKDR